MDHSVSGICEQVAEVGVLLEQVLATVAATDGPDPAVDRRARTDDRLRALVVGMDQVRNAAEAAQAAAMASMGHEALALDAAERATDDRPTRSHEEFVPDEIGVLLGCTKMAANARYSTAWQGVQFPAVAAAWRAGRLDARKVSTICEQVGLLTDDQTAQTVAGAAVAYATAAGGSRTAPQLREWLRRRVVAADPDAAERRRRGALADRRVVITPGEDGVSELWALLPAVQARQIQQALTTTAQGLGTDDGRTMDQRRADTLVDLLLGRGEPAGVSIEVIISADTLQGTSDDPAWIPGLGPITAPEARELAGVDAPSPRVSLRRLLADPTTGVLTDVTEHRYRPSAALDRAVRARDVTCRFPGCRRCADSASTDLDHTVPWPAGPTSASNLAVLCRRHHRLKHTAGWTVSLSPNGSMTWTTPTGRTVVTLPWQYTDPPTT